MQKNAIIYGMSINEFLHENPILFYLYEDTYLKQIEIKTTRDDNLAWQQGIYFLRAIRHVFTEAGLLKRSEKSVYPKKPLIERAETKSNIQEKIKMRFIAKATSINKALADKGIK